MLNKTQRLNTKLFENKKVTVGFFNVGNPKVCPQITECTFEFHKVKYLHSSRRMIMKKTNSTPQEKLIPEKSEPEPASLLVNALESALTKTLDKKVLVVGQNFNVKILDNYYVATVTETRVREFKGLLGHRGIFTMETTKIHSTYKAYYNH
jgi:hypothetical protein